MLTQNAASAGVNFTDYSSTYNFSNEFKLGVKCVKSAFPCIFKSFDYINSNEATSYAETKVNCFNKSSHHWGSNAFSPSSHKILNKLVRQTSSARKSVQESRRFQRNPSKAYCIIIILSSINIITDSSSNLHKRYNCNMKFQHEGYTIQLTSRIFRRIFCAHKIKMVSTVPSQAKNRFYGFWCCIWIAWAR